MIIIRKDAQISMSRSSGEVRNWMGNEEIPSNDSDNYIRSLWTVSDRMKRFEVMIVKLDCVYIR